MNYFIVISIKRIKCDKLVTLCTRRENCKKKILYVHKIYRYSC